MTGYVGNAGDVAQELAMDHVNNLVHEARQYFDGRVLHECEDCGEEIPAARVEAMKKYGCTRCVKCQSEFDKLPKARIRMLDHVL
jgi:phage/conjugal plasmid C-4 type zinc finger TraR family protein